MKVLIAGGFGFVGARVAQALQAAGHAIVLGSRTARLAPAWLPNARVSMMDWRSIASLQKACTGVDAVIHAAGMNASACAADPVAALEFNGLATARLVEAAIAMNVASFFYCSTAHVYASPLQGEIDEQSCPRNAHPYASSHLAGEFALLHALSTNRIAGGVLRLSNGFGVPLATDTDCWTLLTNDLCRQAATSGKLVLRSSGSQHRDFLPLKAVSDCFLSLMELQPESLPSILNLGSGESLTVLQMTQLIQARCQAVLGFTPAVETGSRQESSLPLRFISRHAARLGLLPVDPMAEIDGLLAFCKERFAA
jgi:UDP-glucose 4-epimerase